MRRARAIPRRRSFTVALVGPDGSGKTTVAKRLVEVLPVPATYVYMGISWQASTHLLPTTRFADWAIRSVRGRLRPDGDPDARTNPTSDIAAPPARPAVRVYRALRARLSLLNLIAEEWYRQAITWTYLVQGVIVIFDRHFYFDYHADHVAGGADRPLRRRIHGFLLAHVLPRPDLVVYLDAPADLLYARKGEGTVEWLTQRKGEYLAHASSIDHFAVVDAGRPLDQVVADVADLITSFPERLRIRA